MELTKNQLDDAGKAFMELMSDTNDCAQQIEKLSQDDLAWKCYLAATERMQEKLDDVVQNIRSDVAIELRRLSSENAALRKVVEAANTLFYAAEIETNLGNILRDEIIAYDQALRDAGIETK